MWEWAITSMYGARMQARHVDDGSIGGDIHQAPTPMQYLTSLPSRFKYTEELTHAVTSAQLTAPRPGLRSLPIRPWSHPAKIMLGLLAHALDSPNGLKAPRSIPASQQQHRLP
ncbi:hypothetical protein D9611_014286 [Ephemerocybe angulata]|uniref:Uncharacterized protein n=1 Tax=Ephemerocybe angulata TaxID=980116 RepID=A0A8H5F9W1_9AGAR|nr:hypothetical protein D9611_014286 [Tulosesus angulatus]